MKYDEVCEGGAKDGSEEGAVHGKEVQGGEAAQLRHLPLHDGQLLV